jgi:hypothetical protein
MIALVKRPRIATIGAIGVASVFLLASLHAFTLEDLTSDPKMTPKRFASRFGDFTFQVFPNVQDPEVFLSTENGNCQDYAIMADYVLKRKNYATMLVHVVLACGAAHDICYVAEVKGYLDYNNRVYVRALQRSGRTIREIADKAADSFDQDWTTASVYTYEYSEDVKHLTMTIVKTDPPAEDPDRVPAGATLSP